MQPDSSMIPIEIMLESLDHDEVQACSISSVPDEIRDPKEDAFKPKVVSIGPLHRGTTRHLQLMEEPKGRYMREFLDRNRSQQQDRSQVLKLCGNEILRLVRIISTSYGGIIELEPHELAKIMIMDGCFLLELIIKLGSYMDPQGNQRNNYDPILENEEKMVSLLNDITMLENQIPFIVLKKLYRKVFPESSIDISNDHRVANLVRKAFGYPENNSSGCTHILHLMHLSTVQEDQQQRNTNKSVRHELVRCATRLRAVGIIIQAVGVIIQPPNNTGNHSLVDTFNFDINFRDNKLEIPVLVIKETTEVRWRNLIAWEQSKICIRCKYTSYALFFQSLICCEHDLELLQEKGVIINESRKSKEELVTLFRTISKGADHMDSSYTEICANLNSYRRGEVKTALQELAIVTWHRFRRCFESILYYLVYGLRILIRDHCPTVWKFIGVLAAVALLVLACLQTYYSSRSIGK